jgi:urocanate hydratase
MNLPSFQKAILQGIPNTLPDEPTYDASINHAPKRKDILTKEEKKLAVRNALRYFPVKYHVVLAKEFADELKKYGRIYMYRFRPAYVMKAQPIHEYPHRS